jgi:hypothetical protein
MPADPTRVAWFATLLLVLGLMTGTPSQAQERQPVEVLKGHGLKRSSGASWTLAGEAVILKNVREARALSSQLSTAQE